MRNKKSNVLIKQVLFNVGFRLRYHKIKIINEMGQGGPIFEVKCSRRLIIATMMNLIDNSIWWLDNKGSTDKRIYVGSTLDLPQCPSIIVADNGPGFDQVGIS
ncbi:MAG: hypothetical protein K8T10_15565 [Candidatus Eremiobacteraeota bacterium]|nr:hypothetical protein [Candidatus Eremiobacteraeota bacterium]